MADIYNASAQIAKVGANFGARIIENERNRPAVQAANAEFKLRKNVAEQANNPEYINSQLEALHAQNQQLSANQAKSATFDAFRRYTSDYNPRHINSLMKSEPLVREAFGNPVSFERVDPTIDSALLNKFQIAKEDFDPRVHLKVIDANGDVRIQDIRMDMAGTGYLQQIEDEELDRLIKMNQLFGKGDKQYAPGGLEKDTTFLAEQGIEGGDHKTIATNLYNDRIGGNAVAQQHMADKAIDTLFEVFGGEEEYFNTDFNDTKNRVTAERYIRRLEEFGNVKLPAADRADLKELNTLVRTGSLAVENLTPEVTGAFDSLYRKVKNYISNDVDEIDRIAAQSAYSAFRNTTRHALYGSALTASEIESFNEAFGTIRQKYPAVVTQFITGLEQTKSKLETVYQMNNPVLAKYYMGKSGEDLAVIIRELDNRIEMFKQSGGERVTAEPGSAASVDSKQTLDDIFNSNGAVQ